MPDLLTLTGIVATPPRHITTNSGLEITSFRLASGQRRYDRDQKKWVEAETNWYTVTGFRQLALNIAASIERGQHVLVTGRLRIRAWENSEKSGTTIEIEADAVGHDLSWGTSVYTRSASLPTVDPGSGEPSPAAPGQAGWAEASHADPGSPTGELGPGDADASLAPAGAEAVLTPF